MSRAERVEAVWLYIDFADYLQLPEVEKEQASAALAASDALLRTDAAVERVARAISWESSGIDKDDWAEVGAMSIATKESFRDLARAVIAAMLDGEA